MRCHSCDKYIHWLDRCQKNVFSSFSSSPFTGYLGINSNGERVLWVQLLPHSILLLYFKIHFMPGFFLRNMEGGVGWKGWREGYQSRVCLTDDNKNDFSDKCSAIQLQKWSLKDSVLGKDFRYDKRNKPHYKLRFLKFTFYFTPE